MRTVVLKFVCVDASQEGEAPYTDEDEYIESKDYPEHKGV